MIKKLMEDVLQNERIKIKDLDLTTKNYEEMEKQTNFRLFEKQEEQIQRNEPEVRLFQEIKNDQFSNILFNLDIGVAYQLENQQDDRLRLFEVIHKEVKSEKQLLSPIEYVQIKNFFPPVNNFNLDIDNSELIRFAKDMFKNEENKFENKNFGLNFLTLLEELDPNVQNDEEDV